MKKNKSSISKATSYTEIGLFWDKNDITKHLKKTKTVHFDVAIESEVTYVAIEKELSNKIRKIATQKGIAGDTLVNLWMQEKLQQHNI